MLLAEVQEWGTLQKINRNPFVKIDKKLIDKVIENFIYSGFKKIVVITGYKSSQFKRFKKIHTIKNQDWKKQIFLGV